MNDDFQRRAVGDFAPPLRQLAAFVEAKRVRFSCAAADEGRGDAALQQMGGLLLDDGEVERAVRRERCVRRGDETVKWMDWFHFKNQWVTGAGPWSVSRGLMSKTSTTDNTAALAKMPKMPKSGTCRSRRMPKPQSAKPPQLMLTRFMMP